MREGLTSRAVRPGATSSFLFLLVAMPGAPSSFELLVRDRNERRNERSALSRLRLRPLEENSGSPPAPAEAASATKSAHFVRSVRCPDSPCGLILSCSILLVHSFYKLHWRK